MGANLQYVGPFADAAQHAAKTILLPESNGTLDKLLALGSVRFVRNGAAVYHAGDSLRSLYVLKTGIAKRTLLREDGREQILGFPMPGELLGIEALGGERHVTSVVALDLCAVVEIPCAALEEVIVQQPQLVQTLYRHIAAALREEHGWLAAIGLLSADQRVIAFLLDLSRRYVERGYSGSRFRLRMTRAEIGAFLGLTLETVSRAFSRLQRERLLSVERREIAILDRDALIAASSLDGGRIGGSA